MARQNADTNSSTFEFLHGDIEYSRKGGCFVTTRKAIIYLIITVASSVIVGLVVYYYGPKSGIVQQSNELPDIDKLLNDSINSVSLEDTRLPTNVLPLHYRLKIYPIFDEYGPKNFTFTGHVSILIQCTEETKTIELNAEELDIQSVKLVKSSMRRIVSRSVRSLPELTTDKTINRNGSATSNMTNSTNSKDSLVDIKSTDLTTEKIISTTENLNVTEDTVLMETTSQSTLRYQVGNVTEAFSISNSTTSVKLLTSLPTQTTSTTTTTSKTTKKPLSSVSTESIATTKSFTGQILTTSSEQSTTSETLPKSHEVTEPGVYLRASTIPINIVSKSENKSSSKYTINLKNRLKPGNYTLSMDFSGIITDSLKGLYITSYIDKDGKKRWLLSTQFGPVYARSVFPCFDEPSFKAPFEISLARRTNMTSLSNMPLKETETMNETGWVMDHFQKTPPISTYLVAFAISDFKNASVENNGPLVTIWTPNNQPGDTTYPLNSSLSILRYFENYFGIRYSLRKLDLIAIPELPKDAVENFGLLFFNERSLVLQPHADDQQYKKNLFNLLASQLAQQWFGNMVSIKWWTDLWLSKGFALFMAEEVGNSLGSWTSDFTLQVTQYMLNVDDFKSSHSLHQTISNSLEITQLFDMRLYYKGSCLLRMLNHSLSENVFKMGVRNFFKKWSGKSANETDFWNSISEAITNNDDLPQGHKLEDVMLSWTSRNGYPVVTIIRDYDTGGMNISQARFQIGNYSDNGVWIVPLSYVIGGVNNGVRKLWLSNPFINVNNVSDNSNSKWVLFNIEQTGFYRVNYDTHNWKLLIKTLKSNPDEIPVSNRGQLLNDAFELAENGQLNYSIPFELAQYLVKETNYVPWSSVLNSLNFINGILHTTHLNGAYEDYIVNLVSKLYDQIGPDEQIGDSPNDKILRKLIVETACNARYPPCLNWAKYQVHKWMNSSHLDDIKVQHSVREIVFCTAIRMGGRREWEFLWNKINSTSLDKERFTSLGCSRDPWLINRLLEYTLNGTIGWQNAPYVWKSVSHYTTISVAFKFLREHWNKIYETYKDKTLVLKAIVTEFLYALSSKSDLEDLRQFFSKHENDLKQLSTLIQGVVDRIRVRVSWTEKYMDHIATWLTENNHS